IDAIYCNRSKYKMLKICLKIFHNFLRLKKLLYTINYDSRKKVKVQLLISIARIVWIIWIARFIDIWCLFMTCFFSVVRILLFIFFIAILCFLVTFLFLIVISV